MSGPVGIGLSPLVEERFADAPALNPSA